MFTSVVAIVVLIAFIAWFVHTRWYPWKVCPRCGGTGKINRFGSAARTWATCPRCHGDKKVRRLLARQDR